MYQALKGDKLDCGLVATYAQSDVLVEENGYNLALTSASFGGEVTLTGTLNCVQDSQGGIDGEPGDLFFIPDAECKIALPTTMEGTKGFALGNISSGKTPDGLSEIVNTEGKNTAKVEITIKNIRVEGFYAGTGRLPSAEIVSFKAV